MKDNNNTNNCADNRFLPEESSAQKRTKSTKTTLPYPSYVVLYFCTTHVAGENLIKPHDNDYYMLWDTKAMCGKYDVDYLYYLFDTKNKVL